MRKFQEDKKYIIWAIDPFAPELKPNRREIAEFAHWADALGYSLLAVHLLQVPRGRESNDQEWIPDHVAHAERELSSYVKDFGLERILTLKVLTAETSSHREAIRRLVGFAESITSPWILVSTEGRTGLSRLFRKEFAEVLAAESKCPVLFLTRLPQLYEREIHRALFITDFSAASQATFRDFLRTARTLSIEVVIYHQAATNLVIGSGMGNGMQIPPALSLHQERWVKNRASSWLGLARRAGVKAFAEIERDGYPPLLSSSILAERKRIGADMIVLTSYGGEFASFMTGSASRDILRANQCPVWVYGPKSLGCSQRRQKNKNHGGPPAARDRHAA